MLRASDIEDDYKNIQMNEQAERQKSIEQSSKFIGLVVAMFSPLSFITGIYGMNFVDPDGNPGKTLGFARSLVYMYTPRFA